MVPQDPRLLWHSRPADVCPSIWENGAFQEDGNSSWFPLNNPVAKLQNCGYSHETLIATGAPTLGNSPFGPATTFASGKYYRSEKSTAYNRNWTVCAWVMITSTGVFHQIAERGIVTQQTFSLYIDNANKPVSQFTSATSVFKTTTGATALVANRWYHLIGTYNSANLIIYLNGAQDGTSVQTLAPQNGTGGILAIGTHGATTTEPLIGSAFDLRVFSRALSVAEITALYQSYFVRGLGSDTHIIANAIIPVKPGKKPDEPPAKGKKAAYLSEQAKRKEVKQRRLAEPSFASFLPQQYLSPPKDKGVIGTSRDRFKRVRNARERSARTTTPLTGFLPQEYFPLSPTKTVWRECVKIIKLP